MATQTRTVVIQGSLAYGMRRAKAARANDIGLQILNMPQMASRLAGGFCGLATPDDVEPAIRNALRDGGFQHLDKLREMPGLTRALTRTLRKKWQADLRLSATETSDPSRLADILLLENRIRKKLPAAACLPPDLRDLAVARASLAPRLLGAIRIEHVHFIDPVWRPLISKLCEFVPIEWLAPPAAETGWFGGHLQTIGSESLRPDLVSCADPRHEALEALRWVRALLATGKVQASEIAVTSASTDAWDDHIYSLASQSGLRVHFPHGIPCLGTLDGQRCAALANVLLNGLSQNRVRRLFALAAGQKTAVDSLSASWLPVSRDASLNSIGEWRRALDSHGDSDSNELVLHLLSVIEKGAGGADEAAAVFLRGRSRRLWDMATRGAPAAAVELTLKKIRVHDEFDPADSVAWCPAWQLAAAPRAWVRMLGLTSQGWPRQFGEDPILPSHNILRALAGLYLALAAFWLYAAINEKCVDAAILTAILFAGGLAAGRCVSLIFDGRPAFMLMTYLAAELGVVLIGYWVFKLPK